MKWIAIGLNVLLILTVSYFLASKGAPAEADGWFLVVVLFAAPLSSLAAFTLVDGESWVALYFKRKALEEKQRIKSLSGQ